MDLQLSHPSDKLPQDFNSLFININTLLLSSSSHHKPYNPTNSFPPSHSLHHSLSLPERALIGATAGAIAGAFTYVCLLPIDAVKTKLQARGASRLYAGAVDAALQTFRADGLLGFYRGVSAVLVGSASSSAVYFGTCEFTKSLLSKAPAAVPLLLVPPAAGAMGNIVSSAIMVPKELVTQRMQTGAAGRSWEVVLRIVEKDGVLGLYKGYAATLLRNLPAGILSYSSFEYLKGFLLGRTGNAYLEPGQSVLCGALAGGISAVVTTPLDVVKTRLMTEVQGEGRRKILENVREILVEEGWAGLGRGIGPRVLHSACFSAIGYFAFETARFVILHQYVSRKEKRVVDGVVDGVVD